MSLAKQREILFEQWYSRHGTRAKMNLYFQALRDPYYVLDKRAANPARPGFVQTVDRTLFPPRGSSLYELTDCKKLKALFDGTAQDVVADDGSMRAGIGCYALWLRLADPEEWEKEPFWDGDCASDGSPTGRTRMATLLTNGFDYLKALENRKRTYKMDKYLAAIRTKPFILLAGISGTGKSRMVRQLARGLCPDESPLSLDPQDPTKKANKPGNFESIPVKPNWHDSTELLGYVTRITEDKKPKFVLTPFVKFLAKAWMNENVPFFLCLDEMNLAPVEQYFAEYLSVIESRDWVDENDHSKGLQTDVMVHFDVAQSSPGEGMAATTENFVKETVAALLEKELANTDTAVKTKAEKLQAAWVKDGGIRIPANLVVMGTVNMDETTCSFSRKVLDRAMSFELNDVSDMYAPDKLVGEGDYEFGSIAVAAAKCSLLTGKEAYDANAAVGGKVLEYLKIVNEALEGKKFKIAYRSRNEIMIYCVERTNGGIVGLRQALDEATNLKILSRIEGDDQTFASFDLKDFRKTIVKGLLAIDNPSVQDSDVEDFLKDEAKVKASPCASKLGHMIDELSHGAGVVSYWE